jgi:hypothetical protein
MLSDLDMHRGIASAASEPRLAHCGHRRVKHVHPLPYLVKLPVLIDSLNLVPRDRNDCSAATVAAERLTLETETTLFELRILVLGD